MNQTIKPHSRERYIFKTAENSFHRRTKVCQAFVYGELDVVLKNVLFIAIRVALPTLQKVELAKKNSSRTSNSENYYFEIRTEQ